MAAELLSLWDALGLADEDLAWQEQALCAQTDPEAFYIETGSPTAAQAICARCPVQAQCLDYALAHDERFGVWGGTSARQRRALRRHREAVS